MPALPWNLHHVRSLFLASLRQQWFGKSNSSKRKPVRSYRPQFEQLEKRELMAGDPIIGFQNSSYLVTEAGTAYATVSSINRGRRRSPSTLAAGPPSAQAGVDYTETTGTLVFAPGITTLSFTIATLSDTIDEPNEDVRLTLAPPVTGTLGQGTATLTIEDNDNPPQISISDATVTEGDSGQHRGHPDHLSRMRVLAP